MAKACEARPRTAVVAGAAARDRVDGGVVAGGSVLYGAAGLAACALPWSIRVVTTGDPHVTRAALEAVAPEAAVELQRAPEIVEFENRYDDEARIEQRVHARAPLLALPPGGMAGAALLVLAPVLQELDLLAWCAAASGDTFVALGVQGMVRAAPVMPGPVLPQRWAPLPPVLERLDAVFASEEDLASQPALLERLAATVPVVVVTRGARGALAYSRGEVLAVPAHPATVVDPTGAGDTFAAVAAAHLALGWPLHRALDEASRLAARAVERRGIAPLRAATRTVTRSAGNRPRSGRPRSRRTAR